MRPHQSVAYVIECGALANLIKFSEEIQIAKGCGICTELTKSAIDNKIFACERKYFFISLGGEVVPPTRKINSSRRIDYRIKCCRYHCGINYSNFNDVCGGTNRNHETRRYLKTRKNVKLFTVVTQRLQCKTFT